MSELQKKVALAIENAKRAQLDLKPLAELVPDTHQGNASHYNETLFAQAQSAIDIIFDALLSYEVVDVVSEAIWETGQEILPSDANIKTKAALTAAVAKLRGE